MKDSRIAIFRKTLESLIDSLDATVRVGRWSGPEQVPDPLKDSAAQLVTRLGAANRLVAGRFSGSAPDMVRVKAIAEAVRRLDAAYVAYCRGCEGSANERDLAVGTLEAEIHEIRVAV
jgi:hypothetical protein